MLRNSDSKIRDPQLYYWLRDKKGSDAEVDFVVQLSSKLIPIEVKAGKSGLLKSLHVMMKEKNLKTAFRFDTNLPSQMKIKHLNYEYELISLPLYMIERWYEII